MLVKLSQPLLVQCFTLLYNETPVKWNLICSKLEENERFLATHFNEIHLYKNESIKKCIKLASKSQIQGNSCVSFGYESKYVIQQG